MESLPRDTDPVFAAASAHDSPFVGQWAANLSKSKLHPANQFQNATIELAVDGDILTICDSFVDAAGREEHSTHTIEADGIEHLSGNGYGLSARWRGSRLLETVATKDGQVVGRGSYEVSTDRMTLTISAPEQVIVLDRTGS